MVMVCDAIMGSGKSEAAITYINEHPDERFIYITPYLTEADRIRESCPAAHFVEPRKDLPSFEYKKSLHTAQLLKEGKNIASTHQGLNYFTGEMIDMVRDMNYTLIIDEEISVLREFGECSYGDVQMAIEAGYIRLTDNGSYVLTDKQYLGGKLSHMFRMMESRAIVNVEDKQNIPLYQWIFPVDLFKQIGKVFVLTYLFLGSEMDAFFKINGIDCTRIYVKRDDSGVFRFCEDSANTPQYVSNLKSMIHIEQNEKMNNVGRSKTSLSMRWYKTCSDEKIEKLRNNIQNFFIHKNKDYAVQDRMCGTFKDEWGKLRKKGYWNSNVTFSIKSSNEYRNKRVLAYPVNIFMNPILARYYKKNGAEVDADQYALSIMIQWIWRSAIRDGQEIWLYVPSRRMRELLVNWINNVSCGSETSE